MPAQPPAVDVEDLTVAYGPERRAVDGVSLRIDPGQVVGLLGPNGSGKTTLFRVLATLLKPTAGHARVFGHDVTTDRDAARRQFAVVFQSPALDKELTPRENLHCHGRLLGLGGSTLRERTAGLLDAVGVADRADEPTKRLSGGQRRRVEIAKGLLAEPPLLMLDEPTVGLDVAARRQVWDLLDRLRQRSARPTTVLVTTHLMDEAARCDRLALLDRGRIVADDSPNALVDRVGGDVVTLVPERPADAATLAAAVVERLGERPESVSTVGGAVRVERAAGHELVARAMADPAVLGVPLREASVGRPTLEDVFLRLTGRGLGEDL